MAQQLWRKVHDCFQNNDSKTILDLKPVDSLKKTCSRLVPNLKQLHKSNPQAETHGNNRLSVTITLVPLLIGIITGQLLPVCNCNSVDRRSGANDHRSLEEWREVFNTRSEDDWRMLWHKEKHRRCQHQLITHMELVCEKDIYKLARKKRKRSIDDSGNKFNGKCEL